MLTICQAPDWANRWERGAGSLLMRGQRSDWEKPVCFAQKTEGRAAAHSLEADETAALREQFSRRFSTDPEGAIGWLKKQVSEGISQQPVPEVLLPYLANAGYGRQNLLISALQSIARPHELIQAALAVNQRTADREMLLATAGLLEHYGSAAWPALTELARSRRPECRYFVRQIADCDGIPDEQRQQALATLATTPDLDTRWEIIELLDGGWLSNPDPVWQVLRDDPDDRIKDIARDRLESHAP
jgi:hypothetical protein